MEGVGSRGGGWGADQPALPEAYTYFLPLLAFPFAKKNNSVIPEPFSLMLSPYCIALFPRCFIRWHADGMGGGAWCWAICMLDCWP